VEGLLRKLRFGSSTFERSRGISHYSGFATKTGVIDHSDQSVCRGIKTNAVPGR